MMMLKSMLLLGVGCLAQNDRVLVSSNCSYSYTFGEEAVEESFDFCATSDGANPITVFWELDNAAGIATIAVRTPSAAANWCAWGISDSPSMIDSSVIIWGGGVDEEDQTSWDRVIGAVRVAPTPAAEGGQQADTDIDENGYELIVTDSDLDQEVEGLIGTFNRQITVAGLAATRNLVGEVNLIAACGTQAVFGTGPHDLDKFWVTLNVETGECAGCRDVAPPNATAAPPNATVAPTPDNTDPAGSGAAPLQVASLFVAAGVALIALLQ